MSFVRNRRIEVPSLQKFALAKLIESARRGLVKLVPEQIPDGTGAIVWYECDIQEIIKLGCHPYSIEWFSSCVTKRPTRFSVEIRKEFVGDYDSSSHKFCKKYNPVEKEMGSWKHTCKYWLSFQDKYSSSHDVRFEFGNAWINPKDVEQFEFMDYLETKEAIGWICKLFRTEIHHLEIAGNDLQYEKFMTWEYVKTARVVTIRDCKCSDFLEILLPERHKRNLRTIIHDSFDWTPTESIINNYYRVGNDYLRSVEVYASRICLHSFSTVSILMFFIRISSRIIDYTTFLLPDWTDDQLKFCLKALVLKQGLNGFTHIYHSAEVRSHEKSCFLRSNLKGFRMKANSTAIAFYFGEPSSENRNQVILVRCSFLTAEQLDENRHVFSRVFEL